MANNATIIVTASCRYSARKISFFENRAPYDLKYKIMNTIYIKNLHNKNIYVIRIPIFI